MFRTFRPFLLIMFGVLLISVGFIYDLLFAGIPYQDPSPAQQARWGFHKQVSSNVMTVGLLLALSGVLVAVWKSLVSFRP